MSGIYIHIPFCARRCVYCGFFSTTNDALRSSYVRAVVSELHLRRSYLGGREVRTIYIGGGTPSHLALDDLKLLLRSVLEAAPRATEVTVECNPDDVTAALCDGLLSMGVNRVSMGIQSFDDARLRQLHRRHDARQAVEAVEMLHRAGFHNLSIDLMFGFPDQTVSEFDSDLSQALRLGVPHLSAYSLMYEEGTPLYRQLEQGLIHETDEETLRRMYDLLCDRLTSAGYEHYEISNFALPGYRSRHNSSYWTPTPYLGLGAGAHSYDLRSRQWNVSDVGAYIRSIERGEVPCEREELDAPTRVNDRIATALRTCEGLDLDAIAQTEGERYARLILESSEPYLRDGLLRRSCQHLILTRAGIHVSDLIMSDLMIV